MKRFKPFSITSVQWFWMLVVIFASQHVALFGSGIPLTVLLVPLMPVLLWRQGIAVVDSRLRLAYIAMALVALASLVVNKGNPLVSAASPAYLVFMTAPFVLRITAPTEWRMRSGAAFWSAYKNFMILAALLGFGQILLGDAYISFRDLLPEAMRLEGYNTTNAISADSSFFRANGFFFYEPSFFSQFLGIAILVEMWTSRRASILLLYVAAMLTTFSGTGLILMTVGLIALAIERSAASWKTVVATLLPLPLILVAGVFLFPDFFIGRVAEFNEENSSAYIRFVSPALYIVDSFVSSVGGLVLGVGPGVAGSLRDADVMADFPGIGKMLFEYGVLGGVAIMVLYIDFCAKARMASWVKWPLLLVQVFLNNGIFTPISIVFFMLLALYGQFVPMPATRRPARPRPARAVPGAPSR